MKYKYDNEFQTHQSSKDINVLLRIIFTYLKYIKCSTINALLANFLKFVKKTSIIYTVQKGCSDISI